MENSIRRFIAAAFATALIFGCSPSQGSDSTNENGIKWAPMGAFCSKLDFKDVHWPDAMSGDERTAMSLALNISGSFEGGEDWKNITNNFDGEGLSLGLLNQCLGEGSLQPLLIQMRDGALGSMSPYLTDLMSQQLLAMLDKWKAHRFLQDEELRELGMSRFDDEDAITEVWNDQSDVDKKKKKKKKPPVPLTKDQESVRWAVNTLYSDKKGISFRPEWRVALQNISDTGEYRSIQLRKALRLHTIATDLLRHFKLTQLRSYLFFFDIAVQNGGIPSKVVDSIDKEFEKATSLSEIDKLNLILKARLKLVKKRWVADVRERKTAIINGAGKVHGTPRDFQHEYCADVSAPITHLL